jgi:probable O-glycosylation ligase (exosortase A-associated)
MKQTAFMLMLLATGTAGPVVFGPFIGVAIYYLLAVLRPQYLWQWALLIDLRWSFYVAAATIAATLLHVPGGIRGKVFTWRHGVCLAFAVCVTLSNIFAFNSEVSSHWYWEYVKIFLMFFCGSLVVQQLSQVRILYQIAVWALGYIAYEINFVYLFSGRRLDVYHSGYGDLDNNGAGLMIAMGVPLAYFLWQEYRRWWRWIFLAMVPVMIHAVLMTYSRGAMVSLLIASSLLIVRSRRKRQMMLALVCFWLVVPILAGQEIRARFFSIEQYEQDRSAESRFDSWTAGWRIARDYPIVGVGLRNSELLSQRYGADTAGRAIHSQYIQITADSGFPAVAFYILLLFGTWRALRRTQKLCGEWSSDDDRLAYNLASGLEGALVVFCIGAAFLSLEVFELPYLLILLALKLSLVVQEEPVADNLPSTMPKIAYQPQNLPA